MASKYFRVGSYRWLASRKAKSSEVHLSRYVYSVVLMLPSVSRMFGALRLLKVSSAIAAIGEAPSSVVTELPGLAARYSVLIPSDVPSSSIDLQLK